MRTFVLAVGAAVIALTGLLVALSPRPAAAATPVLGQLVLGHSVEGRPILAYHLGDYGTLPRMVIVGQMHGDEHAGVTLTDAIVHARRAVEGINLWVVPTMNPDGDAAHTRQNARGVDLNRNWPDKWAHLGGAYYSGRRPSSEPETRAMSRFLTWAHPRYLVVLHQPLHGVDATDGAPLDRAFRDRLAHNLDLPVKAFNCWSVCHGSMTGWFTTHRLGIAETIEFGAAPTTHYLTGRARDGILAAMGARWGELSAHNPAAYLGVGARTHGANVHGWSYDRDDGPTSVFYDVADNGTRVAGHHTGAPSQLINDRYGITGTHGFNFYLPLDHGEHDVCLTFHNRRAGTGNTTLCQTVQIPAQ